MRTGIAEKSAENISSPDIHKTLLAQFYESPRITSTKVILIIIIISIIIINYL